MSPSSYSSPKPSSSPLSSYGIEPKKDHFRLRPCFIGASSLFIFIILLLLSVASSLWMSSANINLVYAKTLSQNQLLERSNNNNVGNQNQQQPTTGFTIYQDPQYGISISYPSDWIKLDLHKVLDNGETQVIQISPPDTEIISSQRSTTVKVTVDNNYGVQSLKELLDNSIQYSKDRHLKHYKVHESNTNANLAGKPAYWLVDTDEEGYKTKNLRVGTLTNDKIYFVLYWAQPQDFDRYLPVVNQIISSFKLIGNDQQSNIPPGNTGTSRDSDVGFGGTRVPPGQDSQNVKPHF